MLNALYYRRTVERVRRPEPLLFWLSRNAAPSFFPREAANMRYVQVFCAAVLCAAVLLGPTVAFGWSPIGTHPTLMSNALHDAGVWNLISTTLTSGQISTISGYTGDSFSPYHGYWETFENRAYNTDPHWTTYTTGGTGGSTMPDETTKLCYLMHNATDSGVPVDHAPANRVYSGGTLWEALLEAEVATWSTYPNINGTSVWHTEYSETFSYTGTYWDVVQAHIAAVTTNAGHFKNDGESNHNAGWDGTAEAQLFARAFIADYLLQKKPTVANAGSSYTAHPGGSVIFTSAGSLDPDSVSWATNGTYSNNGSGLGSYAWDLGNGNYADASGPSPNVSYSDLVSMVGHGTKTIHLRVTDNEGSVGYAEATLNVDIPEPSVFAMLVGLGVAALIWRLRRR